jgi:hypothetical protein
MRFYKHGKGAPVKAGVNSQGVKPGADGRVVGRRRASSTGTPEYLVKFRGRSNPVSLHETELD